MSERELFVAAHQLTEPAARAAFLDRECGANRGLRDRVVQMLDEHENLGSFLEATAASEADEAATGTYETISTGTLPYFPGRADPTGAVIAGKYALLEVIGEGGMGSVWRAKQTEPVKRFVAVKLIKAGMDSREVLNRFEAERQALAVMDHPNIAKVLDGGLHEHRPYFVMELVKGVPITQYCDQHRLTPRQRLELFVPVCQAIQHAHQKGIIHRDIKPSNVLVAVYDDKPVVKVIDFGVAKATGGALSEATIDTAFGGIVGTPQYMSPEQATFNNLDIDTRTDVYSLGVLLYELLTGTPPFSKQELEKKGILEVLRVVREEEPPRPSTKLSTADALPSISANRGTEPKRLTGLLRNELDWIVMKALEKDRTRRYETANGFAADVLRYLNGEAVQAHPPSTAYRVKKFVRRNRGQVIAASLVLFALLAGIAGTTWGLFEARFQEGEARKQEKLARDETVAKEAARQAAADRVVERDAAVKVAETRADDLKHRLALSNVVLARAAFENRDTLLAIERLDRVPPDQRDWERRYLKQLTRGGLFTLYGHTARVNSASFSPDGARIVTGGDDGRARVWDAKSETQLLVLPSRAGDILGTAFSPDSTRIVTAGTDAIATVWDAAHGTRLLELKGHTHSVVSASFSRDGTKIVTGSLDGTAKVWDAKSGDKLVDLKGPGGVAYSAEFSPDGSKVLTAGDDNGWSYVWDAKTGERKLEFGGHAAAVNAAAFSPDGTRIVTGSLDHIAKVRDAVTGKPLFELKGNGREIYSVAWSPDGTRIATGGADQTVRVWDATNGSLICNHHGHSDYTAAVAFSPDGTRLVTASHDKTVKVWDARSSIHIRELGHGTYVSSVALNSDGTRITTAGNDNTARVWDARTGAVLLELKGHQHPILALAISRDDSRIATGGDDNKAKVWDAASGSCLLDLKGHAERVNCVTFSPNGRQVVTGSDDKTARVWDTVTGALLFTIGHAGRVCSAVYTNDGKSIVTGHADTSVPTINFWDPTTGKHQHCLPDCTHPIWSLAFSRDGERLAAGGSGSAFVWHAKSGALLAELKGHTSSVNGIAFMPDGKRVVTASQDTTVVIWDVTTGMPLFHFQAKSQAFLSVAVSRDGKRLVAGGGKTMVWEVDPGTSPVELEFAIPGSTGQLAFSPDGERILSTGFSDKTAKVWDARTGKLVQNLVGHTAQIWSLAYSADGSRIATGGHDNTGRVWDAATGTKLLDLTGHTGFLCSVCFSPDGQRIVSGGGDNIAKVWNARTGRLLHDLKGHKGMVMDAWFSADGSRIATRGQDGHRLWDAATGNAVKGESPPMPRAKNLSPDGRRLVRHVGFDRLEVVRLQPDEREIAYRRIAMQPDMARYREGYNAARAAKDDFAAAFYFKLSSPAAQQAWRAEDAAAEARRAAPDAVAKAVAAGRTQDALPHLALISEANPQDTILLIQTAALQAWFGREEALGKTCRRAIEYAADIEDAPTADRTAKVCCLLPTKDQERLKSALALARRGVELGKDHPWLPYFQLSLGMAAYRNGNFAEADAALIAAAPVGLDGLPLSGTAAFFRAMSLFHQGKTEEARKLAREASAKMIPFPEDEKNPLVHESGADAVVFWLACKEARKLLSLDVKPVMRETAPLPKKS